jgi:hypothetical protein
MTAANMFHGMVNKVIETVSELYGSLGIGAVFN